MTEFKICTFPCGGYTPIPFFISTRIMPISVFLLDTGQTKPAPLMKSSSCNNFAGQTTSCSVKNRSRSATTPPAIPLNIHRFQFNRNNTPGAWPAYCIKEKHKIITTSCGVYSVRTHLNCHPITRYPAYRYRYDECRK